MFFSPNNIIAACIKAAPDNPAKDGVILYLLMAYGYNLWAVGSCLKYMAEPPMMLWGQPFTRRSGKCPFLHFHLARLSDIHNSLTKQKWDVFSPGANFAVMTYRLNYFLVY